jgi:tetratricopeptide (TPR) repeat protein
MPRRHAAQLIAGAERRPTTMPNSEGSPAASMSTAQRRLSGLSPEVERLLDQAGRFLQRRDAAGAERALAGARALAPEHPEVLRLSAVASILAGRAGDAVAGLKRALIACPDDPLLINNLGSALNATGDTMGALAAFRRACELGPTLAAAWYNFGKTLKLRGESAAANAALDRALALAPEHVAARIVYADNLKALGRIDEAASAYRAALHQEPGAAHAWWGLANLKTVRFDAADAADLEQRFGQVDAPGDRPALGFALAKALEDQGRYAQALDVLHTANALRRRQQPWDAAAFSLHIDAVIAAFSALPPETEAASRGNEVIFVVSLPRAGSTLVEQIIAAHPEVEGAGELPDLAAVIAEESARRGISFPAWVGAASAQDWQRLGERYLERTAHWRRDKPRFTDKSLLNGPFVGAAAAMLPGARFVHCRRDPIETVLSCYRQWFNQGQAWTYALDDIVAYWRDHERLMQLWSRRLPDAYHAHSLEDLLADPETSIRSLLDFCGLPFDVRCLEFHLSERSVRTASAAQVRQPLRREPGRAARYGALLDPLRRSLGDT